MTQQLMKRIPTCELIKAKMAELVNKVRFSSYCCLFSLRQGTIMIGIVRMTMSSFNLFLLLLAAIHAQDIIDLVNAQLQWMEEHNEGNEIISLINVLKNENKLLLGKHLVLGAMVLISLGLISASIDFIASALLLYGAIGNSPSFLVPWMSIVSFSLISYFAFFVFIPFLPVNCKSVVLLAFACFYAVELHSWLVVFSHYQDLRTWRLKIGNLANTRKTSQKTLPLHVTHQIC